MKRRSKGGENDKGISIMNEDGQEYISINLDDKKHLDDLHFILCYGYSPEDIVNLNKIISDVMSDLNTGKKDTGKIKNVLETLQNTVNFHLFNKL